jgi:RNA polymerase-binding transcription factor DksA
MSKKNSKNKAKKAKKSPAKSKAKAKSKVKAKAKPKAKAKAKAKPKAKKAAPKKAKKAAPKPKAKKATKPAAPKAKPKPMPAPVSKPESFPVIEPALPETPDVQSEGGQDDSSQEESSESEEGAGPTRYYNKGAFHHAAKEYNPFLQSNINKPKPMRPTPNPDERTRYSEEELKEFEVLITEKLEAARKELTYIKEVLSRKHDPGTDTTAGTLKLLEDGSDTAEKENFTQLAARQQKFIQQLENAMARIKNGTYGICIETGKLIPKERLRAVPHTQHSIEAKLNRKD